MLAQPESNGTIEVTLVRPGAAPETHTLSHGATVGDLLRQARADSNGQALLVEGRAVEASQVLRPRSSIYLMPASSKEAEVPWWRKGPIYPDDDLTREYFEELRAAREAEREAARRADFDDP